MKNLTMLGKHFPYSLKLDLKMKLTFYLFLISIFQIHANSYSQNTKISLELQGVSIENVLREIESKTEFKFLYNDNEVDYEKIVSVEFKKTRISKILESLFSNTKINYEVLDKQIVLLLDANKADNKIISVSVPQKSITGTVKDDTGMPLPGASVIVKGTTKGTSTDFDGNFSISLTENDKILVVSYIGYVTKEITVGNQTKINVTLESDAAALDEVVVVGYGSVRKSDLTGSVSRVGAETIAEQPSLRVADALQGRTAGVQVQRTSGTPDGDVRVRIRGTNSIQGNNNPLYVIDGVFGGNLSSINTNDIKSIEVLKDASATAIYGSQGSNGVILVTTKTAKFGKTSWSFNGRTGFDKLINEIDYPTPYQFTQIVNQVTNGANPYSAAEQQAFLDDPNKGTNWFDESFRTGINQSYQISAQGGSEKMKFYVSGTYDGIEGIAKNDSYDRYGLRANLNFQLNDKVKITFNNNFSRRDRKTTGFNITDAYYYAPDTEIFDEIGDYTTASANGFPTLFNPVYLQNEQRNQGLTSTFNSLFRLDATLLPGLSYSFSGSIGTNNTNNTRFNRYEPGADKTTSTSTVVNSERIQSQITNQLNYTKTIGEHSFTATAVQEILKQTNVNSTINSTGFISNGLEAGNLSLATSHIVTSPSNQNEDSQLASFLGRVNYNFAGKYLFTASYRADGSSKFADGNKWAYFPSAALAWKISSEEFLADNDAIDLLKLRLSYGLVGSQAINPYGTFPLLEIPDLGVPTQNGVIEGAISLGTPPNPDLVWETTAQYDIGFDLELFNNRVTVTADYYYKKTSDLLFAQPLPISDGPPELSQTQNVGEMENKGFEFLIAGDVVRNKDFRFNLSANLSINENTFLGVDGIDEDIPVTGEEYQSNSFNGFEPFILRKGFPLGTIQGYIYEGPYRTADQALATDHGFVLGDPRYRDISGPNGVPDGLITTDDVGVIGDATPDYTLGINASIEYKNFDFSMSILSVQGFDILNIDRFQMIRGNTNVEILNAWSPQNESASHWATAHNISTPATTQYVEDGSFIRLKNVTLGYTLPSDISSKIGVDKLKLFVNAQNLITITDYSWFDPEATNTGNRDQTQGVNLGAYPNPKSFSAGINLTF